MPLEKTLLDKLKNKTYDNDAINLSGKKLQDKDVDKLIELLAVNPSVTELNLSNNELTEKTLKKLVANTTLKTLRLKPGNPAITVSMLSQFLNNTTLTCLPFTGGGPEQRKLRQHIKENANRPQTAKTKTATKKILPKTATVEIPEYAEPESGQDSFLSFAFNLLFDMENFNSEKEYIVWYTAIALNLYMHNASHKPMLGYGKAQALEEKHVLYYARSQVDHPNRMWHDKIAKNKKDTRKTSVSPINAVLRKLIVQTIQPEDEEDLESKKGKRLRDKRRKLIAMLKAINAKRGFPSAKKEIKDYFSLFLAHAGLRVNNFRVLIDALEEITNTGSNDNDIKQVQEKLKELLPKRIPKKIAKLNMEVINTRIQAIQQRFLAFKATVDTFAINTNLQKQILEKRKSNNTAICESAKKLVAVKNDAFFRVEANGPSCIYIIMDQQKIGFEADSTRAYLENFTNVILGFFQGLINYHARLAKLHFRVDRRQSFGFLNTTLTDTGELTLRLSLGVEPELFNKLILSSLKDLQVILSNKKNLLEKYPGMRSEKKHWQAGFEAQFYLEQECNSGKGNVETAFKNYLEKFIEKDETQVTDPITFSELNFSVAKKSAENFKSTPLFAVLQNLVKYATEFAAGFTVPAEDTVLEQLKHSYLHSLLKLYQHCHDAVDLLNNIEKKDLSLSYKEANSHIQNIMEYLIALDSLQQIHEKTQHKVNTRLNDLLVTEKNHAAMSFKLVGEQIKVYLLDNGQQAITTSLLAMDWELFLQEAHEQRGQASIYNFNESYYELDLFLQDVGGLKNTDKQTSTILFIDITQLHKLSFKDFPETKVLVVDITRQPDLTDEKLNQVIGKAHQRGLWVVLSASCLKHDELGTDKYTAGKIITLAPSKKIRLHKNVTDIFESISNYSMHPAVASYLQIVNKVCGDKIYPKPELVALPNNKLQLTLAAKQGLKRHGLLKSPAEIAPLQEVTINTATNKKVH